MCVCMLAKSKFNIWMILMLLEIEFESCLKNKSKIKQCRENQHMPALH